MINEDDIGSFLSEEDILSQGAVPIEISKQLIGDVISWMIVAKNPGIIEREMIDQVNNYLDPLNPNNFKSPLEMMKALVKTCNDILEG